MITVKELDAAAKKYEDVSLVLVRAANTLDEVATIGKTNTQRAIDLTVENKRLRVLLLEGLTRYDNAWIDEVKEALGMYE
jgi:hypothetical protein